MFFQIVDSHFLVIGITMFIMNRHNTQFIALLLKEHVFSGLFTSILSLDTIKNGLLL